MTSSWDAPDPPPVRKLVALTLTGVVLAVGGVAHHTITDRCVDRATTPAAVDACTSDRLPNTDTPGGRP